eukprot:GHVQ01006559.1.p1 GENE.GHVQ01006559.1~~GHVQ01006559.1.p1  ORF type:complete len:233 (+),score=38.53 GHVQ01006559.1:132-830(+)
MESTTPTAASAAPSPSPPSMNSASASPRDHTTSTSSVRLYEKPDMPDYERRRVINLYSETEIVRNVADYVSDCLMAMGYEEDHFYTNVRIAITGLACAVALYATIWIPFPHEANKLRWFVVLFFGLLSALFLVEASCVKNAIISVKDKYGKAMFIDGYMSKMDGQFVLAARQGSKNTTNAAYVGTFFDSDGFLVTDCVYSELRKLLVDFECGMTDAVKLASTSKRAEHKKRN